MMQAPALSDVDRALLESGIEREARQHAEGCAWCSGWNAASGHLMTQLSDLINIALAHGHEVTIVPHPTEVTAGIVIRERSTVEPVA